MADRCRQRCTEGLGMHSVSVLHQEFPKCSLQPTKPLCTLCTWALSETILNAANLLAQPVVGFPFHTGQNKVNEKSPIPDSCSLPNTQPELPAGQGAGYLGMESQNYFSPIHSSEERQHTTFDYYLGSQMPKYSHSEYGHCDEPEDFCGDIMASSRGNHRAWNH